MSIPPPAWMAAVSSQKVLFQERNWIETDWKQSSVSLLETRMRWFQFVLERTSSYTPSGDVTSSNIPLEDVSSITHHHKALLK